MLTSYQIIGMHTLVKLEHEFHNKSNEYAKYKKAYNIACPLGLPCTSRFRSKRAPRSSKAAWREIDWFCLQKYTSD